MGGADTAEYQYPYEKRVIIFTSLAHALMHMFELVYAGVLILLIREFDLSLAQAGILVFPNLVMLGIGSFPAGVLCDRWSPSKLLLFFFFGSAIASILIGLSDSTLKMAFAFGLMGLMGSAYHPAGLALISMGVRRQGVVMGIHGIAGNLGLAFSPFIAGLIGDRLGWQWAFFIPSGLGLILGVALLLFPIHVTHKTANGHSKVKEPEPGKRFKLDPAVKRTLIWLYGVMITTGFVYRGLMTYLPKYIGDNLSVSWLSSAVVTGGLFTSITLVSGGLGQIWSGHMGDKKSPFWVYVRLVPVWMPLLIVACMLQNYPLIGSLIIFHFFFFGGQPLENQMLAEATPPSLRGSSYGLKFFLNMGIGAIAAPICGWVGDKYGMIWIFYLLALVLGLSAIGAFKMNKVHQDAVQHASI